MISANPESILCHCLRITVGQVQEDIAAHGRGSVRDVMKATGAGRGCMGCHARIRALLNGQLPISSSFLIPACAGCSNPACGCRAGHQETVALTQVVTVSQVVLEMTGDGCGGTACGGESCPGHCG